MKAGQELPPFSAESIQTERSTAGAADSTPAINGSLLSRRPHLCVDLGQSHKRSKKPSLPAPVLVP